MDAGGGLRSFCEAAHAITVYIVGYYSALRPHEYNGGLSPNESENRYWKNSNSVASFCWPLHTFNVVDDFNYEALSIENNLNLPASQVVAVLCRWTAPGFLESVLSVNSGCQIIVSDGSIISFFCFCRWDMALPFQQSSIVIPVHPRECGQLIILTRALPLPR